MYAVTQDFNDKMRADLRRVDAKVVIDYTDPTLDQSIGVSVTEQANVSYPAQTADGVAQSTHKWASLDGSWVLDGSYHLAPGPEDLARYQFGWWSAKLAGADMAFSSPYPTLTVTHIPRPVHTLRAVGDSARGEYPVDFQIDLYGPDNTLLKSQAVTGNSAVEWSMLLPSPVLDVAKQVLTITKWSHPGRQAKILEFFTSIQETYESGDVVEIRLLEEREASQGSLPVGNISANEIAIRLANEGGKFDVTNPNSPLAGLLKPNRMIRAWLGIKGGGDGQNVTAQEQTQADFQQGTLSGVQATASGLELANVARDWNDNLIAQQTLFGTGASQSVGNGVYTLQSAASTDAKSRFDFAPQLVDLTAEIDVVVPSSGDAGLCYRTTYWGDANDTYGYYAGIGINSVVLGHGSNSSISAWTQLASPAANFAAGSTHRLRIVVSGTRHQIYVDGALYIDVTDSTFTGSGGIGVRVFNCTATFDNFVITTAYVSSGTRTAPVLDLSPVGIAASSVISWTADTPLGTSVGVDVSLDGGQTWQPVTNGEPVPGITPGMDLSGKSLLWRENLVTSDPTKTPTLKALAVQVNHEEWVPLGTFWSLDWDSPDDALEATVTARDRLELLRKSTYHPGAVQQNVYLYTLAEQVLQDAGLKSGEYAIDPALQSIVVPWAWLSPTSHREALRIIAEAALAVVYADRDGVIRIESLGSVPDTTVATITAEDYFPPLQSPSRQDQVANEIVVTTQPLRPAATPQEVYRSTTPVSVPAGQTVTVTAFYTQQPVIEAVASLDAPPAGVSITAATYYAWGANVTIQNTGAAQASVTVVVTGKPLSVQGGEQVVVRDPTSITENGTLRYEFPTNPLVQTLSQAQAIANALLASAKDPRRDIEVEWRGNPALELGDRMTVVGQDVHVIRQEITWAGSLSARLTGRKV